MITPLRRNTHYIFQYCGSVQGVGYAVVVHVTGKISFCAPVLVIVAVGDIAALADSAHGADSNVAGNICLCTACRNAADIVSAHGAYISAPP